MQSMDLRNQALVKVIYADGELPERLRQQGQHDEAEKHQLQNQRPPGGGTGGIGGGFNQPNSSQVQEQNPFATSLGVGPNAPGGSDRFGAQGSHGGFASGQIGGQIPGGQMGGAGGPGINTMGGQMSGLGGQISGANGVNGPLTGMQGMSGQMGGVGGQMSGLNGPIGGMSGPMGGFNGQGGMMGAQMGSPQGQGMSSMGGQMSGMNSGFGSMAMHGMGSTSNVGINSDHGSMMGGGFAGQMAGNQSFDRMGGGYPGSHTNSQYGSSSFGQSGYPGQNSSGFGTQSYNSNVRSDNFNSQWHNQQGQGPTQIGGGVGPHQSLQNTGYPGMASQPYGTQSQTTVLLTTNQVTGQAQPHWINTVVKPQPKDEIEILREWFGAVDQDNSGSISQEELASALEAGGEKFNFYTVKMMIDMFDRHSRGLIDFLEFTYLFGYIKTMRASFEGYDVHRVGSLGVNEINQALLHAGYRFANPQTLLFLCDKFDKKRKGSLSFENFLELGVYLGSMRTAFQKHGWPTDGPSGYVTPQFEAFVVQELAKLR